MRHGLIGVTSLYAYNSAILSGYETSSFFKRAAIMCDHIFIDTQGLPADSTTMSKIQDDFIYMLVGGKEEAPSLAKSREFRRLILRPQDLGDEEAVIRELYPRGPREENEQRLADAAFNTINDLTDEQLGMIGIRRSDDYKKQGALILELVTDLHRASRLKRWLDEPVGLLTPLHQRVLAARLSEENRPALPFLISAELEQVGAIDFAALSWREIMRLRRSSFRDDFRDRLDGISRSGDINVSEALWQDLWRFAREAKPSALRTTISGIVGSAPLPLATPLSVVASIAETQRAHELAHEFGWLFFILAANPALP
jgi:hypothetical protein